MEITSHTCPSICHILHASLSVSGAIILWCLFIGGSASCSAEKASGEPGRAEQVWLHATQARELSPLMARGSQVNLPEADALGDFILPAVATLDEKPALDSWAEFTVQIPSRGTYSLWGRFRTPTGVDSLRVEPSTNGLVFRASNDQARQWHWVKAGKLELPAGPWTFRVCLDQSVATVFISLKWRQAELTRTPRLNALCLTTEPNYVPTDADAQRALGVKKTQPSAPQVTRGQLADGPLVANRKRVPEWMRVPRCFTKDSSREELQHRHAGDITALVREVAANGGEMLRLGAYWGGETYFQSRVAPHAPGLGRLDYLREAMDEAKRCGVKVVVYMNPNALYPEHPLFGECLVHDPDGQVSQQASYGASFRPSTRYTCVNHPRYRQFLRDVLTEIFTRYKADGLYVDGLTPRPCFCGHCRAKWRALFGSEMPAEKLGKIPVGWAVWGEFGRDPQPVGDVENDPDARRWTEMMRQTLVEVTHEFSVTVKKAKPDAVTLFHSHPKRGSENDYDGTLTEVFTPRPWVHVAWRSGELAGYSAVYHVPVLFNVYPHRHDTAAEARCHALQGLANGAYPNFWNALGMKPVFGFMTRCAEYLDFDTAAPVRFLALPRDIRVSDTQQKAALTEGVSYAPRDRFLSPYVGAYSALMRSGLPVVTLHRPNFEDQLDGFKVLVLANVALMSDAQAESVRRFVRDGGGLIATHETSLYDEKGQRRKDFALADVMGVHYQSVSKAGNADPVVAVELAGAEKAGWLAHQFGKGRVVYLPGRQDSVQCYEPTTAIEKLFANAVRWVAQDAVPVEIEAPGIVGVTLFRQPHRLIVHLVNHQRDSLFRSDACTPINRLSLRVSVPDECRVQQVRRLWENRSLPFQVKDKTVSVEIGRLDEYEAVAVEWEDTTATPVGNKGP